MLNHFNSKQITPKRVVILGAKGFVGSTTLEKLKKEQVDVLAIGREDIDFLNQKSTETLANILRSDDALLIISAKAPCKNHEMMLQNVQIMKHICDALTKQKVQHVIYISSDAVYADARGKLNESSPTAPDSLHGAMHLAREIMLKSVVNAQSLAILRPTLLYGANDPHNGYGPNSFSRLVQANKPIVLFGRGEEQRDHVYINDVAEIINLCLLYRSYGILNITTGDTHSFHEIAELLTQAKGTSIQYQERKGAMPHNGLRAFDIQTCQQAFPQFQYTPLQTGLSKMHEHALKKSEQ